MEGIAGVSPRRLARIAGALYLVNIAGGAFAIGFVPATLVVAGDPAATAHAIQAHEPLYRLGLLAHLVVTLTNVPLAVVFLDLFRVVNRRVTLLVVCFTLVGTAVEAAGLVGQFTPVVLLGAGGPYAGAVPAAQLQALAYLPAALSAIGYSVAELFFGCYAVCLALLVFRSTFLPRAIGVLLAAGGLSYLVYSVADLVAPGFAALLVPWVQLPALLGEGSLCVWFLVAGVNAERWRERASASTRPAPARVEAVA
jgi:hypothetical protein